VKLLLKTTLFVAWLYVCYAKCIKGVRNVFVGTHHIEKHIKQNKYSIATVELRIACRMLSALFERIIRKAAADGGEIYIKRARVCVCVCVCV
jgi:hypothetical protein